jgi:hypothetical protein
MGFWKGAMCAIGGLAVYRFWHKKRRETPAAFAQGQGAPGNDTQVRDAGPEAMRDLPARSWTEADEAGDESFPASDPPGNY